MSNYEPTFSPLEFFKNGSSLWRWVKYGHGESTPFVNPFSRESLTAPYAPHIEKRIENLILRPEKLPAEFHIRAKNFSLLAVNLHGRLQANDYPGDGYLFFTDIYYSRYYYPIYSDIITIDFFNYIYSFRHLLNPALFSFLSELRNEKKKIKIFYMYRSLIFGKASYFNEYKEITYKTHIQRRLEIAFLEHIFGGHSLYELANEIDIPIFRFLSCVVYKLLEGFTPSCVKRILFNSQATRRSIMGAVNLISDTQDLINQTLPQCFDSIAALRNFHNAQMEYINKKIIEKRMNPQSEYVFDELLKIINSVCEDWYIPKTPIEILKRGREHQNCVGMYFERHFCSPDAKDLDKKTFSKTIIIFNKEAEAELRLIFKKKNVKNKSTGKMEEKTVATSCVVIQCRTKYNREYPQDIPDRLCKMFLKCDITLFTPVRKK